MTDPKAVDAKERARAAVRDAEPELIELSHRIHANPELKFEEERASEWVAQALAEGGFAVDRGVADLPTALVATAGSGDLVIGICAEYDALPEIGHACGHNIIAASAVGAGLALAPLADELGITVKVLGTPAEEGGGGKVLMMDRGAFDGVHAAMMVHPVPLAEEQVHITALASTHMSVTYTGKAAHAAAYPQLGLNALDALTVAQVAIGLLRQHLLSTDRIHGIITAGGDAPNVIPEHTSASFIVRAATLERMEEVERRVSACFEAGALATGCEVEITTPHPAYSHMEADADLERLYEANATELGRPPREIPPELADAAGSTDMANVSLRFPTIHPYVGVESGDSSNHQAAFAAACATPSADDAVVHGALAMAWTAIDAATDGALRDRLLAGERVPAKEAG
jgi:amidohydrolase